VYGGDTYAKSLPKLLEGAKDLAGMKFREDVASVTSLEKLGERTDVTMLVATVTHALRVFEPKSAADITLLQQATREFVAYLMLAIFPYEVGVNVYKRVADCIIPHAELNEKLDLGMQKTVIKQLLVGYLLGFHDESLDNIILTFDKIDGCKDKAEKYNLPSDLIKAAMRYYDPTIQVPDRRVDQSASFARFFKQQSTASSSVSSELQCLEAQFWKVAALANSDRRFPDMVLIETLFPGTYHMSTILGFTATPDQLNASAAQAHASLRNCATAILDKRSEEAAGAGAGAVTPYFDELQTKSRGFLCFGNLLRNGPLRNSMKECVAMMDCADKKAFDEYTEVEGPTDPLEKAIWLAGAGQMVSKEDYVLVKHLGVGGSAIVFEGRWKDEPDLAFAAKLLYVEHSKVYKELIRPLDIESRLDSDNYAVKTYGYSIVEELKHGYVVILFMELGDETLEDIRDAQEEWLKFVKVTGNPTKRKKIKEENNGKCKNLLVANIPYLHDLLKALVHAQERGVFHRDVKTESK